jgi:aminoglycoside phosphotransferase (APT) family kinase protein
MLTPMTEASRDRADPPTRTTVPAAEVAIDARRIRRMLREQHPDLADLPLRRLGAGWDTEVFRLGRDLTVRVPRRALGAQLIGTELAWLPGLAGTLPLPVPAPVRAGTPTDDYPWPWSVCRYVPGRPIGADVPGGRSAPQAAAALAGFLSALHVPAPPGAPRNTYRGVPLADRAEAFARALAAVPAHQRPAAGQAWRRALAAPPPGRDTWLHGDLHGLNVLAQRGRLTGVIDFGDLCVGDPATDLACAWLLLDAPGRRHLRALLDRPDGDWERGRGWALYLAVMFAAHSADAPVNSAIGRRALAALLAPG